MILLYHQQMCRIFSFTEHYAPFRLRRRKYRYYNCITTSIAKHHSKERSSALQGLAASKTISQASLKIQKLKEEGIPQPHDRALQPDLAVNIQFEIEIHRGVVFDSTYLTAKMHLHDCRANTVWHLLSSQTITNLVWCCPIERLAFALTSASSYWTQYALIAWMLHKQ
jgi:hypothetical protein